MMEAEPSPKIGPAPAYYANPYPSERGSQREQLIPRKAIPSPEISEPYQDLGPVVPQNLLGVYQGQEWAPGFWRQMPLRGILALFLSLFCMAGSVAVLYRSDGQPVRDWKISPTVYLALLTTGANMTLRFAFNQGVKISWWHKALRGATVRDLHYQWSSGDGFWTALFSGRHFSLVSLASIATTLVVIDQPLIQRASTVISTPISYPVNVIAQISPEIPYGYTGYQIGRGADQQVMTGPMISAFNDYNSQNPMTTNFSGCTDTCTGFVNAGGLAAQCSTISGPVQYLLHTDNDFGGGDVPADDFLAESPFGVTFALGGSESETNGTQITMVVSYTNTSTVNCTGIKTQRTCTLRPATLRYPITLQGKTLSLGNILDDSTVQSFQPPSGDWISIDGGSDYDRWTIGGLYLAATSLFSSNASYEFAGAIGNVMYLPDTLSNQFLQIAVSNDSATIYELPRPLPCTSNWGDPTTHILSALNEMAFRISLITNGVPFRNTTQPPAPQVLTLQENSNINVFHSEYKYLLGSSLLSAMFVLLVAPIFWGWWELGRSVTLNPIEIAKAFDAPFFQGPGSNSTEKELVRNTGSRLLRYGEAEGYGSGEVSKRQLRLADPHEISRPTAGTVYE
jgi:Protein of unknown function (DUF3176)